jgi:hypothetical protein
VADTKLTVDYVQGTNPADLCSPPVGGGYLGAENQAIRVQLIDATHFTWGFDNAAPLYRVKVSTNSTGQKRVITMLNDPRDQARWPLSGQTVELLAWSAVLPNKEKLAEIGGFLTRVNASYDPDTKQFTIDDDVPSLPVPFGEDWKARPDASQLGLGANEFFYMRVWNRGSDTASPNIDFQTGNPVILGQTGLMITITGNNRQPGDHWIIAARPESPKQVVPWLLKDGRSPHGYRRFYAPLGLIEWTVTVTGGSGPSVSGTVHDCRETFRPLTKLRGCCTYTVGDGDHSHGDFTSIQTAVDNLPASGGEICVLPGLYQENVVIRNRHNIKIKGCGWRSRVKSRPGAVGGSSFPAFHIDASQHICVEGLQIEPPRNGTGVLLTGPDLSAAKGGLKQPDLLRNITLERLRIFAYTSSAIEMHVGFFVTIRDCRVAMFDVTTTSPAVYVIGDDVLIQENVIQVISAGQLAALAAEDSPSDEIDWAFTATLATGGLHLAKGCDRVQAVNNLIFNGIGAGITLGSVETFQGTPFTLGGGVDVVSSEVFAASWRPALTDPCGPRPLLVPNAPIAIDTVIGQRAGAPLSDILIDRNRIFRMGDSGISVDGFFDLNVTAEIISVSRLMIIGNEIRHCLNRAPAPIPPQMAVLQGYGGVALAAAHDLVVRDNVIEDNGPDQLEPVCGIFILRGDGIDIERNRISNNGARNAKPLTQVKLGPRGGVYIANAIAPRKTIKVTGGLPFQSANPSARLNQIVVPSMTRAFSYGLPAVKIHDNIISVPLGPALVITAVGPVVVTDNHLTSLGIVASPGTESLRPATVDIRNLGVSNDMWYQPQSYGAMQRLVALPAGAQPIDPVAAVPIGVVSPPLGQFLGNGNVLFCDNQCELNLLEIPSGIAHTSIQITSLGDIGFQENQCDCVLAAGAFIPMQVFLQANTLRVSDNRFTESLGRATLSASTFGFLNTTTDNQSTHCLLIRGTAGLVNKPNLVLQAALHPHYCDVRTSVLQNNWILNEVSQA